ncbi:MAG: hypothetical protein ACOC93_02220, partial [Planctomycetota bacterium]
MKRVTSILLLVVTFSAAAARGQAEAEPPAGNLDYWLNQAETVEPNAPTQPAGAELDAGTNPFAEETGFAREDALPGVIALSNGRVLPGGLYTTRDKPLEVFAAEQKRWRRIPLLAVLSITPVVVEEKMALKWRWKAMGTPERVYT